MNRTGELVLLDPQRNQVADLNSSKVSVRLLNYFFRFALFLIHLFTLFFSILYSFTITFHNFSIMLNQILTILNYLIVQMENLFWSWPELVKGNEFRGYRYHVKLFGPHKQLQPVHHPHFVKKVALLLVVSILITPLK